MVFVEETHLEALYLHQDLPMGSDHWSEMIYVSGIRFNWRDFVVYMGSYILKTLIHLAREALILLLNLEELSNTVPTKYSNYSDNTNIFLKKSATVLLEYISIIKYIINLEVVKQFPNLPITQGQPNHLLGNLICAKTQWKHLIVYQLLNLQKLNL